MQSYSGADKGRRPTWFLGIVERRVKSIVEDGKYFEKAGGPPLSEWLVAIRDGVQVELDEAKRSMKKNDPRLVSPWEDISIHSRDSKDRAPKTWQRKIGVFTVRVSRHIHYPPDVWLAECDGVFLQQPMKSKDVREAACQAVAKLQVAIEEARDEILEVDAEP